MPIKHLSRIKNKVKQYDVWYASPAFGCFGLSKPIALLAKDPLHAVYRARKRGVGTAALFGGHETAKEWATYKVRLHNKPDNFRHNKYFR